MEKSGGGKVWVRIHVGFIGGSGLGYLFLG